VKIGDLVKPKRFTAHHMLGIIVEISRPPHPMIDTSYLVYFHTNHINSEHKWVRSVWFHLGELDLISSA